MNAGSIEQVRSVDPRWVDVVVPARDAATTLGTCLEALLREVPREQITVVDDGSRDETVQIARGYGVSVLRGRGEGPAAARNLGAVRGRAPIVLFVDADVVVPSGFLDRMLAGFADPRIGAVQARYSHRIFVHGRGARYQHALQYFLMRRLDGRELGEVGSFAVAVRREALAEVGGFLEEIDVAAIEDMLFGARLRAAGWRIVLAPDLFVDHLSTETAFGLMKKWLARARLYARYLLLDPALRRQAKGIARGDSYLGRAFLMSVPVSVLWGLAVTGASVIIVAGDATVGVGFAVVSLVFTLFFLWINGFLVVAVKRYSGLSVGAVLFWRLVESWILAAGAVVGLLEGAGLWLSKRLSTGLRTTRRMWVRDSRTKEVTR